MLACYAMMERIGGAVIPFFAVATLLTGIVLSVATPWRLLQYWWIVVKLVLAVAVIVTAVALIGDWVQQAVAQAAGVSRAGVNAGLPAWLVVAGSAVHLLFLWAATTISVDKPWGKIKRRKRSAVHQREPAGVIGQH